jgi:hypothetical protein
MEKQKRYKVHTVNHDVYGKGAEARYVIKKRGILNIWYTITDEMTDERYANEVCDKFNKYNT